MGAKILAVDDVPSIVRLVEATLSNRGFYVITATDGLEALKMAKTEKPDLIVLDVMMPQLNGWEVRERLRADASTKDIPIVFLSAVGEFESQLKGLQDGLEDYLTKPFTPAELGGIVERILNPATHDKAASERDAKKAKLKTIVDIMHRDRGA